MAKLFCREEIWNIINEAMQIRGGRGYESAPFLRGRGKPAYPLERALRDSRVNTILEGSSEIMRLFIARDALDFYLKKINPLLDPRVLFLKKIKAAVGMFSFYMFWYPRLWVPCLRLPCARHMRFMENASKRLARVIFHKMLFYRERLARRQNFLAMAADIAVNIFAMSSVLFYTEQVKKKKRMRKHLRSCLPDRPMQG